MRRGEEQRRGEEEWDMRWTMLRGGSREGLITRNCNEIWFKGFFYLNSSCTFSFIFFILHSFPSVFCLALEFSIVIYCLWVDLSVHLHAIKGENERKNRSKSERLEERFLVMFSKTKELRTRSRI